MPRSSTLRHPVLEANRNNRFLFEIDPGFFLKKQIVKSHSIVRSIQLNDRMIGVIGCKNVLKADRHRIDSNRDPKMYSFRLLVDELNDSFWHVFSTLSKESQYFINAP